MASSAKKIRDQILRTLDRKGGRVEGPDGANVVPVLMRCCRGGALGNRVQWTECLDGLEAAGAVTVERHGNVPVAVTA